jgi:hypothetical protein
MAIAAGFTLIGAMVALFMLPETSGLNPDPSSSSSAGAPEAVRAPSDTTDWRQLFSATGLLGVNRFVMAGVFLATFGLFLAQILGDRPGYRVKYLARNGCGASSGRIIR